jgi:chemotaxis protein CheD
MPPLSKWVIPPPRKTLVVGVADMLVSNDPGAELVTYSLGSCLGITLYDPASKVGGLLHVMLPDSTIDLAKAASSPYMFVDSGVPRLFQSVCSLGADRRRLIIKVAGGAQFLDPGGIFNIGERNQQALLRLLEHNGYFIHSQDMGGVSSRTLRMDMTTGAISIRCPGIEPYAL